MKRNDKPRKALGRGLNALLPTRPAVVAPLEREETLRADTSREETSFHASVDSIGPNPKQTRIVFQDDRLEELAQSIRANGIIQPLVVRKAGDGYQLVAGERRLRAAKLAGIEQVPIVVRDIPDDRLLEITLIENIQREDLNPIETALAFSRMEKDLSLNPDEIGLRTGKDRTTVVNLTRLLKLPAEIQKLVADRRITAGHARCLLALPTHEMQRQAADRAVAQNWSVRQLERVTQKMTEGRRPKPVDEVDADPNVRAAIQELERVLGTRVRIVEKAKGKGRIEIEYYSADDLDRIYTAITGTP